LLSGIIKNSKVKSKKLLLRGIIKNSKVKSKKLLQRGFLAANTAGRRTFILSPPRQQSIFISIQQMGNDKLLV